jgi:hypothetical protein
MLQKLMYEKEYRGYLKPDNKPPLENKYVVPTLKLLKSAKKSFKTFVHKYE